MKKTKHRAPFILKHVKLAVKKTIRKEPPISVQKNHTKDKMRGRLMSHEKTLVHNPKPRRFSRVANKIMLLILCSPEQEPN